MSIPPVQRLPSEIVALILTSYVDLIRPTPEFVRTALGVRLLPYKWITVSHICKTWRDIALSLPRLWDHIFIVRNLSCIRTMLERAQKLPLTVLCPRFPATETRTFENLQYVLRNAFKRTQYLELYLVPHYFDELGAALDSPSPALRTLVLSVIDSYTLGPSFCYFPIDPVRLASEYTLPRLERLELSGFKFPDSFSLLRRSLKHLTLDLTPFQGGSVRKRDILDAFRLVPGLQTLYLTIECHIDEVEGDKMRDKDRGECTPVDLAHLAELTLCGYPAACATLLENIRTPEGCTFAFQVKGDQYKADDTPRTLSALAAKLSLSTTPGTRPLQSLALTPERGTTFIVIRVWDVDLSSSWELLSDEDTPVEKLRIVIPSRLFTAPFLEDVLERLPLLELRSMWLKHVSSISRTLVIPGPELPGLFRDFTSLESLHVQGWTTPRLANVLSSRRDQAGVREDDGEEFLFPHLRTLQLVNVQFPINSVDDFGKEIDHDQQLINIISRRVEGGRVLKNVILRVCHGVEKTTVRQLREVVGDVYWDGIVRSGEIPRWDPEA